MNYRERFEEAVNHRAVDRVPFDLAGTSLTSVNNMTAQSLRQLLGFTEEYKGEYKKFDERILKYLDIDFRNVGRMISPKSPLVKQSANEYTDCWGITRVFTGRYWDIVNPPLKGAGIDDLDKYPWPEPANIDMKLLDEYREEAKRLYTRTDYVVVGEHPVLGIMELGCWMCGFDEFLLKMAMEPEFVHKFFDIVLKYQKSVIEAYYGASGEYLHVTISGDDFGTQTSTFISPDMFREMIKPYMKERIDYTRKFTNAYYFHHTCGSVYPIIPDLADAGVSILNPIQPGTKDMEPEKIKRDYGSIISFWGGIDTQHLLCEKGADEVKEGVKAVLRAMDDGRGGYILAPAHNIQADVPPENILAIYEAAKEYYKKRKL